jgi:hypothetical protein
VEEDNQSKLKKEDILRPIAKAKQVEAGKLKQKSAKAVHVLKEINLFKWRKITRVNTFTPNPALATILLVFLWLSLKSKESSFFHEERWIWIHSEMGNLENFKFK